jgi:tagatose 6-phosphate kinase
MILTVTLNPLLERRIRYKTTQKGGENRGGIEELAGGGKGINVSRQLNRLGIDNSALTFTGGNNGKLFKEICYKEGIKITTVRTETETRSASVIIDESDSSFTSYFVRNNEIRSNEVTEFIIKLEKMIQNCEIVVFSGSLPSESCRGIIPAGIRAAKKYDKISFVDTYGSHLEECIDAGPTILHNNKEELERSLEIELNEEENYLSLLSNFYQKGIKQAFITNGGELTYASNFDFHFIIENNAVEAVDPTGSGDAFSAGVLAGWAKDETFRSILKTASGLGAVNAMRSDVCNVSREDAEEAGAKVIIKEIGKKIKVINDNPT